MQILTKIINSVDIFTESSSNRHEIIIGCRPVGNEILINSTADSEDCSVKRDVWLAITPQCKLWKGIAYFSWRCREYILRNRNAGTVSSGLVRYRSREPGEVRLSKAMFQSVAALMAVQGRSDSIPGPSLVISYHSLTSSRKLNVSSQSRARSRNVPFSFIIIIHHNYKYPKSPIVEVVIPR